MATIVPGPVFVNRREVAPVLGLGVFTSQRIVPLLVAALALPLLAAHSFPLQAQQPKDWERPNADTSHGIPKTLLAELLLPRGKTVQPNPQHVLRDWERP